MDAVDHEKIKDFKMSISFKVLKKQEFNAVEFGGGRFLTPLQGSTDNGKEAGLGDWTYQIDVEATNQDGETGLFTVAFQPEERRDGLKAYSGYDIDFAIKYGYDADESSELERFCDYDQAILDALHDLAKKAARAEYERLIELLEAGELNIIRD